MDMDMDKLRFKSAKEFNTLKDEVDGLKAQLQAKQNSSTIDGAKMDKEALNTKALKIAAESGLTDFKKTNDGERVSSAVKISTWYNPTQGYYLGYGDKVGAFVCSDRKIDGTNAFYNGQEVNNLIHGVEYVGYKQIPKQLSQC